MDLTLESKWHSTLLTRIFPNRAAVVLFALLFMISNAWAMQYMCAKMIGDHGLPVFVALLMVHIAVTAFFAVVLVVQDKLFQLTWQHVLFFAAASFIGNVVSLGVELEVAPHISAGMLTLIVAMAPIFTLLFSLLLRTETVCFRTLCGLAMGLAATLAILWPAVEIGNNQVFWILFGFVAPASFGAMSVIIWVAWPKDIDAIQVAFGISLSALTFLVPLAIIQHRFSDPVTSFEGVVFPLLGFALSLIAEYWLFALLTKRGGAVYASCADFGAIAFGLFWAFLFMKEIPTGWMILAALLAVSSLLVVQKAKEA
jgi:drug/metabolite transporter (DMT)-like permease